MDIALAEKLDLVIQLLVLIIVIASVNLLFNVLRVTGNIVTRWTINREKIFNHFAKGYFDKGKYQDLISYCHDKLPSWGRNPHVLFWLARAEEKQGNKELAAQLYEEIYNSEPEWEETIEPYLSGREGNANN